MELLVFLGVALPAFVAADEFLAARRTRTKIEIDPEVFADILDALALCSEAGMEIVPALERLLETRKQEATPGELFAVVREVRAGIPKAAAWRRLAERVATEEVRMFVGLMLQADALGSGPAMHLRTLAQGVRDRVFRMAEKHALEAPVKLMLPMACVFLSIFVIIGGALYLDISVDRL